MDTQILIADDDDEIRRLLQILLGQTGYDLLEAQDARTVFQLLRDHGDQIGVVICDIRMPVVSGLDILEQIKLECRTLPVIMLTGLVDLSIAVEAMKKGAFDYLTKPIKKDDLVHAIEKALNHKKLLDNFSKLQEENEMYREDLPRILDKIAKEIESASLQLRKIREDLIKPK